MYTYTVYLHKAIKTKSTYYQTNQMSTNNFKHLKKNNTINFKIYNNTN